MTALFPRLLGDSFRALPAALRVLHEGPRPRTFHGRGSVVRGSNALARLCAAMAALPPAARDIPIVVSITEEAQGETWNRDFAGHVMRSFLWAGHGELHERLGAMSFRYRIVARDQGIDWEVRGARALGVPLPIRWFAGVSARESMREGRYQFEVRAHLPLVGLLVEYNGTLEA